MPSEAHTKIHEHVDSTQYPSGRNRGKKERATQNVSNKSRNKKLELKIASNDHYLMQHSLKNKFLKEGLLKI